jgi:glycosyltransferase involved in cell wall biosynthesis
MRILQIIQKTQLRGAEIFASQLSRHFVAQGHTVKMIALLDGGANNLFDDIQILHINKARFIDYKGLKKINEIIKEFNPDIIQANAADTIRYAVFSKLLFRWKSPIVYRNANLISGFINSLPKKIFYRCLFKYVYAVASVSQNCLQDFKKTLNWHDKHIAHLPIGVDLPMPTPYKDFHEAGLTVSGKNVFINCAALMPEKNHEGLLRIFKKILDKVPDAELLIFGKGPLNDKLNVQINELSLTDCVKILLPRTDILKILPLCKALLMPSLIEGLPAIILESMAVQLPVFANAIGGIPEVIQDNSTGFISEVGNEQEMADQVIRFICQPESRDIREEAYSLMADKYQNKDISVSFTNYYFSLIKN